MIKTYFEVGADIGGDGDFSPLQMASFSAVASSSFSLAQLMANAFSDSSTSLLVKLSLSILRLSPMSFAVFFWSSFCVVAVSDISGVMLEETGN